MRYRWDRIQLLQQERAIGITVEISENALTEKKGETVLFVESNEIYCSR